MALSGTVTASKLFDWGHCSYFPTYRSAAQIEKGKYLGLDCGPAADLPALYPRASLLPGACCGLCSWEAIGPSSLLSYILAVLGTWGR